jgi:cell division protein FtsI (penicillin-binding protein 3)
LSPSSASRRPTRASRLRSDFRLRFGFIVIAMVVSVFGARLVQLQGLDPHAYAAAAAAEGMVEVDLPAKRGAILDRSGVPLATSINGLMVVADPAQTRDRAAEIATFLSTRLHIDYFNTKAALGKTDTRFAYVARRVPSTLAMDVVAQARALGYKGIDTRIDPVRDYPAHDVAANLVGFLGEDGPLAGFELNFNKMLAGRNGSEKYEVGAGNRLPLGESTTVAPQNGQDLHTTIDRDVQFYVQRVLRDTVRGARGDSGQAVVLDSRTGELLAVADYPTFDADNPLQSPKEDFGSRALSDVYEPGSVEKVLTMSSLIDAGKVTPRTKITVPGALPVLDTSIKDWFPHGRLHLTLTGVLAKSSNIGTVLAATKFTVKQLHDYLVQFGLGAKTNVGVKGESPGLLPPASIWSTLSRATIAFGQGLSVNAVQMAAAINTIANGGVYVSPSLIQGSATTDGGQVVGSDTTTTHRVVSEQAARETAMMMERVLDPKDGVAPGAAVPGYRVAGKTGTAQRVDPDCGCYRGFTVSFAGFAPADKPAFTVYIVVQNPRDGGGGGHTAGPAFAKIMSYLLRRYGIEPTGTPPSTLPVEW